MVSQIQQAWKAYPLIKPKEVAKFIDTEVDFLAPAFDNAHGD
jgi:fructose/tagatose bisphosphate aldolase